MKITFVQNDRTIMIEEDEEGQDLERMCIIFSDLLRGMGYHFDGEVTIVNEEEHEDKENSD